ncbi:MAG: hypothetical protein IPM69_18590 [Ignavibacteria bacterium]|nr:hypothetical protein [Ignavibacteria bacterium]
MTGTAHDRLKAIPKFQKQPTLHTSMHILYSTLWTAAISSLLLINISCGPSKTAPITKVITKAAFRSDWEYATKNYTNSLDDAAGNMSGDDGGRIGEMIQKRQRYSSMYSAVERYADSIAHGSSIIIRIFNEDMLYNYQFQSSKRDSLIAILEDSVLRHRKEITYERTNSEGRKAKDPEIREERKYYLDSTLTVQEIPSSQQLFPMQDMKMQRSQCGGVIGIPLNYSHDSVDCFWLVKNADPVLHILYHTPPGTMKDEMVSFDATLDSAFQTIRRWKHSRQVSIPYEKKYGTMVSYWDAGNSYHVFLPWMWNDEDCENGWRCTTNNTNVNAFHSALQKILCIARQKGALRHH